CAARARYGKSQALPTVAGTGMGRPGGVVCAGGGGMGPPPGLGGVNHTHTAVFSHATDVTSLRTTRYQGTVKRRYRVQTEPSLASNLCVALPRATVLSPRIRAMSRCQWQQGAALRQWHEAVMGGSVRATA